MKNFFITFIGIIFLIFTFFTISKSSSKIAYMPNLIENDKNLESLDSKSVPSGNVNMDLIKYLPTKVNTELIYSTPYKDDLIYMYIETFDGNKLQFKTTDLSSNSNYLLKICEDNISLVYYEEHSIKNSHLLDKKNKNEILLKSPLKVGTKWSDDNYDSNEITSLNKKISTSFKEFETIEVTSKSQGLILKRYYAPNVGLVKSILETGGKSYVYELKSIKENSPYKKNVRIFFYDSLNDYCYYEDKDISQEYGISNKDLYQSVLNDPPYNSATLLSKSNISINSIILSVNDSLAKVDLGDDPEIYYLPNFKIKSLILTLVNTICYNYNVEKCQITVNGQPFFQGIYNINTSNFYNIND
ncbi:GerMN domain-containing protein [Clostridium fallax]|uniref:Sporulation and spore germination n=1 Tax=Clostridium fallax TaxID=1533 RepID=A0A1M4WWR1_9CLOT|nr:GerMN domain-containing protein [Clostridium fallax]SHE85686.1 Sporulation and spore germination [Clostridium fallax]SQB07450.1 sporulation/spore germination protein [Clostridium fallax]